MSIYLFVGPSLPQAAVLGGGNDPWIVCPPVRRGDVYRAARRGARLIGIIDGYFGSEPAVSHKEIMWSLQQGIPVVGASSIGALRAVELAKFGMRGVGCIFRAYARGLIWRDDEVALLHAPADLAFQPLTVPLINVRATVRAGVRAGPLTAQTGAGLLALAESFHFADRTFDALRGGAATSRDSRLAAGLTWLETNYVDAKAQDAMRLCNYMQKLEAAAPRPVPFTLHDTEPFASMRAAMENPFLAQYR